MNHARVYEQAYETHPRSNTEYEFKKAIVNEWVIFDMILKARSTDYFSLWISEKKSFVVIPSLDEKISTRKLVGSQVASYILDHIGFYFESKDGYYITKISERLSTLAS